MKNVTPLQWWKKKKEMLTNQTWRTVVHFHHCDPVLLRLRFVRYRIESFYSINLYIWWQFGQVRVMWKVEKRTFNNPATIHVPLEKYGSDIILIKKLTVSCPSPISKFNGKPFRNNFHRNHRSSSYPLRNKNGSVEWMVGWNLDENTSLRPS